MTPWQIWARQGPIFYPKIFLTGCFLQERIETQNLGMAQAFGALPTMVALIMVQSQRHNDWSCLLFHLEFMKFAIICKTMTRKIGIGASVIICLISFNFLCANPQEFLNNSDQNSDRKSRWLQLIVRILFKNRFQPIVDFYPYIYRGVSNCETTLSSESNDLLMQYWCAQKHFQMSFPHLIYPCLLYFMVFFAIGEFQAYI